MAPQKNMIDLLVKAINRIDQRHYMSNNPNFRDGIETGYSQDTVYPERSFCAQIVSRIEMINANQDWYPHVFIPQTDIFKQLKPYSNVDNIFVSSKRELLNSMGMYPDLTIHKSQDNNAKENQLLALECKISPNLSFLEFAIDVLKLHIYADALKYQNIVYVLINVELDDIVLYIQQYNDKYWRNRDKEICYIIKNGFGGEIFVLNGET